MIIPPLPTSTPIPLSGGSLITNALCIDYEDSKTVDSKFYSQPPYERGIRTYVHYNDGYINYRYVI